MSGQTNRFRLTTLDESSDELSADDYKFGLADRDAIDRLLRVAVEDHRHYGWPAGGQLDPAPLLTIAQTGGSIRAGRTLYYQTTMIVDGTEIANSAIASVTTPPPVPAPMFPPRLEAATGNMESGDYLYAVSACTNTSAQETLVSPTASQSLKVGYGGIEVSMPPMPSGGQFFNVYRKAPRDAELLYLRTLDSDTTWFLDNDDTNTSLRRVPTANTTFSTNAITVTAAYTLTPEVPMSWKVFRTYNQLSWATTLLEWVALPAGILVTPGYTDDGRNTRTGSPPSLSLFTGTAPRVHLADETEGELPPGMLVPTRFANFNASTVTAGPSGWAWTNEYDQAEFVSLRASLGRNITVGTQAIQLGIDRFVAGVWEQLTPPEDSNPIYCEIAVGASISDPYNFTSQPWPDVGPLLAGDQLRLNVLQADIAPGVEQNLTVVLVLRIKHGSITTSYQWETT